jgi:predicted small metal-binding protein
MERYFVDCRDYFHEDVNCSLSLTADKKEELLEAMVQHGIKVHGYQDTHEFREKIMNGMKKGTCHSV